LLEKSEGGTHKRQTRMRQEPTQKRMTPPSTQNLKARHWVCRSSFLYVA